MGFLAEMVQNVLGNFANTLWVQQGLPEFRSIELFFVLFGFNTLELRTHIVVINLEFQDFFVADGIGDDVGMQLAPKYAGSGVCTKGVLRENWRTCKSELNVFFEFFLQVLLRFTELASMALIKNKHHLLAVDRQIAFAFHQVVEFLDSGDNNFIVVSVQVAFQTSGTLRTIHAIRREALILSHGLVIQVFTIHHEKDLVYAVQFCGQSCGLKAGESFARPSSMPDIAATFGLTPALGLIHAVYLP